MKRAQLPRQRRIATYVLPRWKLVFVSTPKAACTSVKWMLADLQGIDPAVFHRSLSSETTRATTIHQARFVWGEETPRLAQLSDDQLREITPDNGWFVFAMSRHPALRLWSAWQSKVLLREPRFVRDFGDQPWFARVPTSSDDVFSDWFRFVEAAAAQPDSAIMRDVHFRPQTALLRYGVTPYDRIYDTADFALMLKDVTAHLEAQGWRGELWVPRSNETPLPALRRAFPPDVTEAIRRIYARDYRLLGYGRTQPPRLAVAEEYPETLVAAVGMLVERAERIGDLSERARELYARAGIRRAVASAGRYWLGRARGVREASDDTDSSAV